MRIAGLNDSRGGFTFLELMIVIIIIGLTAGLVLPRVGAGWKRMEDREFLQDFTDTLRSARLRAMNSGEVIAFRISGSEHLYDLENPPRRVIPPNVDIFADHLERDPETGDHMIVYFPDGSMSGNDIEIVFDRQRSFLIVLHPLFGTVNVSRKGS